MTSSRGNPTPSPLFSLPPDTASSLHPPSEDAAKIHCGLCQDAGYYVLDVPPTDINFGSLVTCFCTLQTLTQRRLTKLQRESNLLSPETLTFESFNPTIPGVSKAYQRAVAYSRQPSDWLVIGGRYGCGKTHLATAIGWEVLKKGYEVLFLTFPDLMDGLERIDSLEKDIQSYHYLVLLRTIHLLILDSFEAPATLNADHRLFYLLETRYTMRLPTIFTIDLEALNQLHPRIHSRLIDDGVCERILVEAGDYRQVSYIERMNDWDRWKHPKNSPG